MTFCVGKEDAMEWWDDRCEAEMDEKDPLYDTFDEETESLAISFSMKSQQDLSREFLWNGTSEKDRGQEASALQLMLPPIQVDTCANCSLQWNLISPCSDSASPCPSVTATFASASHLSPESHSWISKDELESINARVIAAKEVANEQAFVKSDEGGAEEPIPCQSDTEISLPVNKTLAKPHTTNSAVGSSDTYIELANDTSDINDEADFQVSARQSSLSSHETINADWRRQNVRTCPFSCVRTAGMPVALPHVTSRLQNESVGHEDNGDFSSDDEDFIPELHCHRASEAKPFVTCRWRRMKNGTPTNNRLSMSFKSQAMMTKRLLEAKSKLNSGIRLLRSGLIASTVESEKSHLDSFVCEEIKSVWDGQHQELTSLSDILTQPRFKDTAGGCSMDPVTAPLPPTRKQQVRASVIKAAKLVNDASAKAARKLKSRSDRAAHLTRQKFASETEEEDNELFIS